MVYQPWGKMPMGEFFSHEGAGQYLAAGNEAASHLCGHLSGQ